MYRFTVKRLRILLFALCGALLIAAGILFLIQWQEGETAARCAQALLEDSGIKPESATQEMPAPESAEESTPLPSDLQGYDVIARLDIAKLGLSLPVLSETTDTSDLRGEHHDGQNHGGGDQQCHR